MERWRIAGSLVVRPTLCGNFYLYEDVSEAI